MIRLSRTPAALLMACLLFLTATSAVQARSKHQVTFGAWTPGSP